MRHKLALTIIFLRPVFKQSAFACCGKEGERGQKPPITGSFGAQSRRFRPPQTHPLSLSRAQVSNKMQIQLEKNNDMIIKYDFSFLVQENEMQLSPPCQTKQIDLNKSDQGQTSQHNLSSHSLSPQSDSNLFYSAPDEHD